MRPAIPSDVRERANSIGVERPSERRLGSVDPAEGEVSGQVLEHRWGDIDLFPIQKQAGSVQPEERTMERREEKGKRYERHRSHILHIDQRSELWPTCLHTSTSQSAGDLKKGEGESAKTCPFVLNHKHDFLKRTAHISRHAIEESVPPNQGASERRGHQDLGRQRKSTRHERSTNRVSVGVGCGSRPEHRVLIVKRGGRGVRVGRGGMRIGMRTKCHKEDEKRRR